LLFCPAGMLRLWALVLHVAEQCGQSVHESLQVKGL
jgi:hypothetical protein